MKNPPLQMAKWWGLGERNHKEVEKNNPKGLLLQFANYVYGHSTIELFRNIFA
jgi:hypothetical protein